MHPIFEQTESTLSTALAGLDSAQTQLRPIASPAKWSIQQIVEHLLLTYNLTQLAFEARLAKRRPTAARPTLQQRIGQFSLVILGRFPAGIPAPANVVPPATPEPASGQQLLQQAHQLLAALDPLYSQAEDLFGAARAISHQALGPLSVPHWRRFHLVHARHHARQIAAIRREHALS